jgi:hypothetical protein
VRRKLTRYDNEELQGQLPYLRVGGKMVWVRQQQLLKRTAGEAMHLGHIQVEGKATLWKRLRV